MQNNVFIVHIGSYNRLKHRCIISHLVAIRNALFQLRLYRCTNLFDCKHIGFCSVVFFCSPTVERQIANTSCARIVQNCCYLLVLSICVVVELYIHRYSFAIALNKINFYSGICSRFNNYINREALCIERYFASACAESICDL